MADVLVTGCSSGIGLAIARRLAARGDRVFAAARCPMASKALLAARDSGLPIVPIAMDVCDQASVDVAIEQLSALTTTLDVLVNNAGISVTGPLETTPLDAARGLMETNYFGPLRLIRALLPQMRARRAGTIVNISSQAGRRPFGLLGHYCASKHALSAASEVLAHEVAEFDIRVALVEPGVVHTPLFDKAPAPPSTGPYGHLAERLSTMVRQDLGEGTQPDAVAAVVQHAIDTDDPRLHYVVGADAKRHINAYLALGPDGFARVGRRR